MKNATCIDCEREMIPSRLWEAADKGDRDQWRREGKRRAKGSRCHPCVSMRHRAKVTEPRACRACPAEVPTRRLYCDTCLTARQEEAHRKKQDAIVAAQHERASKRAREREERAAPMLALRAEGLTNREIATRLGITYAEVHGHIGAMPKPDESPDVLAEDEGRWITGRGPSGLPIKVWRAA